MEITDVKIRKTFETKPLCGVCSVTFDDCFTVHDIKIIYANDSYFIVMPNKKTRDGRITDVAHPTCREFRKVLEEQILKEYFEYEERMHIQP